MIARRWVVALVAALCLGGVLGAALGTAASASHGVIGIRLLDVPESSAADPRARLYVVDHLAPGTTISRRVEVSNTSDAAVEVLTYAAAATIDDGSFIGSDGRTENELSQWTTVSPGTRSLAAGAVATVVVTVAVPVDAAPAEYYGVVWAEARYASASGNGVVKVNRVGIRMYISVGPGADPAADFTITSLRASRSADGSPLVAATVVNTGGRALDISGSLMLTDGPGGLSAGPFDAKLGVTLAIGSTEDAQIALDARVPDGPWTASITLRSGLTERNAVAVIRFPTAGSAAPVTVEEGSSRGVEKSMLVAAALVGCVALVVLLAARWRRRPAPKVTSVTRTGRRS
jgi:hypothetical protein